MDAILGFIAANQVILGFIIGLLVKYVPALKAIPNTVIPYLNALIGLLAVIFGPAEAQAANGVIGVAGGFLGSLLSAGWNAALSAIVYEVFARHPLDKLGVVKA